ncbi:hypothetical protein [Paenibacillus pasadenensis]|uniref:hypothetical protein n=1 Tax=Paenibacillus pasadenensis TaxID=217090 RepID=UPI000C7C21BD|nr:hypothetical protein [Paenibacillus pasadenensis]
MEKKRKTRSDKKRAIAPYIPDELRVWIHRIARRTQLPEGDVGLLLIQAALQSEPCIVFFAPYLKRDYRFGPAIYCGHHDHQSIYDYIGPSQQLDDRGRFKIKASQSLYEQLNEFQIGLGIPFIAHAAFALLRYALHDLAIVQSIAPGMTRQDFMRAPASSARALLDKPDSSVWSILK